MKQVTREQINEVVGLVEKLQKLTGKKVLFEAKQLQDVECGGESWSAEKYKNTVDTVLFKLGYEVLGSDVTNVNMFYGLCWNGNVKKSVSSLSSGTGGGWIKTDNPGLSIYVRAPYQKTSPIEFNVAIHHSGSTVTNSTILENWSQLPQLIKQHVSSLLK